MALWGDKDNIYAGGTVSLNYGTGVVTGSGTTFGNVGAAATGDVIRFGSLNGVYYGDAVIVGIASTTQLTIGSTAGLSGASIASTSFQISQLPKYTILDSVFSEASESTAENHVVLSTTATTLSGVGTNVVFVASLSGVTTTSGPLRLVSGSNDIVVSSIGTTSVSLASTISSGISTGNVVKFQRSTGAQSANVYGISTSGANAAQGTVYKIGSGWVGLTTYMDSEGNMRVKKEILVAMSGIQTGNTPLYDGNPFL